MLKRKDGKKITPDTFVYSVPVFRLTRNDSIDEEYIYIRAMCENQHALFMIIDESGQYRFHKFSTDDTFYTSWGQTCTAYECEIDNMDVEYH